MLFSRKGCRETGKEKTGQRPGQHDMCGKTCYDGSKGAGQLEELSLGEAPGRKEKERVDMVLYVNACARKESRTDRIARACRYS